MNYLEGGDVVWGLVFIESLDVWNDIYRGHWLNKGRQSSFKIGSFNWLKENKNGRFPTILFINVKPGMGKAKSRIQRNMAAKNKNKERWVRTVSDEKVRRRHYWWFVTEWGVRVK